MSKWPSGLVAALGPEQVGELRTCQVLQTWRTHPVHGSNGGLTVLVLDDHERIQEIWTAILGAAGIRHIGVHDIESAQQLLGSRHVDLVVIDEHLAHPDAFEQAPMEDPFHRRELKPVARLSAPRPHAD